MRARLIAFLAVTVMVLASCGVPDEQATELVDRSGLAESVVTTGAESAVDPDQDDASSDEAADEAEEEPEPYEPPVLRKGSGAAEVGELQARLIELGYHPLTADGHFGAMTEQGVIEFQRGQGLTADGIVGPTTWLHLSFPQPFTPVELRLPEPEPVPEPDPAAPNPGGDPTPLGYVPDGGISLAVVHLSSQRVNLFGGPEGALLFSFPASAGRDALTPRGEFRVSHRSASTVSITDEDISMRWMTNFNGYIGFHGIPVKNGHQLWTPLGEQGVSAGCVRLSDDAAQLIYDHMANGATVIVMD